MRVARFVLSFLLVFASSPRLNSQQSVAAVQRDPEALALLTQVLASAGGLQAFESVSDFQVTGTITYFERDQQNVGAVSLRGGTAGHSVSTQTSPTALAPGR